MSFIENAKKLKKEKGYTTNELSKICGIPLGTLSKLFSGIIEEPKLSAAIAISKALDTTVDALCELADGTYTNEEIELLQKYRKLDEHGKRLADLIISNELSRLELSPAAPSVVSEKVVASSPAFDKKPSLSQNETVSSSNTVITPTPAEYAVRTLTLYNTPVSAGIGEYLDNSDTTTIRVKNTEKVAMASYALRVNGNSMMPDYCDGDILIVKETDNIADGELGIFICDGQGYFKKFGTDRLISLNPDYEDLMLSDFERSECVGTVLGRLKTKRS